MTRQVSVYIWGYTVYKDGTIIGVKGNRLNDNDLVSIKWQGVRFRHISRARFIYWAFNQDRFDFDDKSLVVCFKDKNKGYRLDNLELVRSQDMVRGRRKLTDEQVLEVKRLYREDNRSFKDIARRFHVSDTMIAYLIKGYTPKYIKEE